MLDDALIITRREVRDSLRDWRIVAPIVILTLIFPWIMNASTQLAIRFVEEYNATIIPLRLVPFAVMIVAFFPISFSLIIALETFVGEKERNSLEPLLDTPISDASLYFGKLFSATIPPVLASYLGITAYLVGLYISIRYTPEWLVLLQIVVLTTMKAFVMVSGAVVVSSHTTSVRAANLLASFIIIPMAFLLQGESILLFWGQYDVLWYILAALVVANALLIRTGIRTFNREQLLGREVDELNLASIARTFWYHFAGTRFSLVRIYRDDVPRLLRENYLAIATTVAIMGFAAFVGWIVALQYPLPPDLIDKIEFNPEALRQEPALQGTVLPRLTVDAIWAYNIRSLLVAAFLGLFSFGTLACLPIVATMGVLGFIWGEAQWFGVTGYVFLLAALLPHGIIEIPAVILMTAFALRAGASIIAPPAGFTAGENLLRALADFVKIVLFVVIPLLFIAAVIEVNITPQILIWMFGR
ncbi:MAG: stage II sporulation protein M [Anaerolineae bacterium]|nr:stage II sporulation protein M [Anaerolineae bacterium]